MGHENETKIAALLDGHARADAKATAALFDLLYDDLRDVARQVFGRGAEGVLQPTALVHEAWLRLTPGATAPEGRQQFLALAARVMRHVLIDYARGNGALKRGGDRRHVTLDLGLMSSGAEYDPIALGETLDKLARLKERHARIVELRIFAGMTIAEVAAELGVGHSTVETDWAMARAWLRAELAADSA